MSFLRRQVITAALTANAIRPLPGFRVAFPAFFAGWMTGELAPHLLVLTVTDTMTHTATHTASSSASNSATKRRSPVGLVLAGASSLGLGYLIAQSRQVGKQTEASLVEALGIDYIEQLDAKPTPAELATPWRKLVYPFRVRNVAVKVDRNVRYSQAGSRGLLDVYSPADDKVTGATRATGMAGAPVLLQVHGGGWTIGHKEEQGVPLMQHLAAKGWVCVAINYRLAPRDAFPAQVIDVKRAIAWIKEHIAEYGGDPDYIAITGGSAGGHLTALAALTAGDKSLQPGFEDADTTVQVAVPHYGIYDFAGSTGISSAAQMRDSFLGPRILQKRWLDSPEDFEAASPILRITPEAPDFFVLHGQRDSLVAVEQARLFVDKLKQVSKRSVVYAELPGAQHAFDLFPSIRSAHVVRAIDRYLHWHWNQYLRESAQTPP